MTWLVGDHIWPKTIKRQPALTHVIRNYLLLLVVPPLCLWWVTHTVTKALRLKILPGQLLPLFPNPPTLLTLWVNIGSDNGLVPSGESHTLNWCWPRPLKPCGIIISQWDKGWNKVPVTFILSEINVTQETIWLKIDLQLNVCHAKTNWGICQPYTVETLYSTIYYSKYFIDLNFDKSTQYVALWTHKRHPISRPFGRAMECLLWALQQKLTVL